MYAVEGIDNPGISNLPLQEVADLQVTYDPGIAGGVNVVTGKRLSGNDKVVFRAIPFYAIGNRGQYPYNVWLKN